MEVTHAADPGLPKQPLPPTILQDSQPLEDTSVATTTSYGSDSGGIPQLSSASFGAMMDSNPPSALTDTLSSFSSGHSSFLGGSNNNNNSLSTFSSSTSTSASRRSSMQFVKPVEVRETLDASVTENADGYRQLKQYILKGEIGKGAFGKVHLAVDENTDVGYAVKEFSKSKLRKKDKANLFKLGPRGRGRGRRGPEAPTPNASESSPLDLIRGEIAILKKLHHPNIVKLYEVLDVAQDDSMYMVFEWCEKGVLMPVSLTETYESVFSDEESRDVFQQMILGIEYLHEHDIIHRDIKPDNLLRSGDGTVKIVDFGVSEMFNKKGDDLTKKSAGSPAFMAPELCRHDHGEVSGRATDVWSMGITLYCLRYGRLPYVSESILEMQRVIREQDFVIPDEEKDPRFRELISRLLEKDPIKRITIEQLRSDPWVTNNDRDPLITKEENTENVVTEVTEEDLRGAIQRINSLATVLKAITRFKRGMKSPTSRSGSGPGLTGSASHEATEMERMQDAEEDGANSIAQNFVSTDETQGESTSLDDAIMNLSLKPVETTEQPSQEAAAEVSNVSLDAKPVSELESTPGPAPTVESANESDEPEGYQVCDMETGLCYWVPSSKARSSPSRSRTSTTSTIAAAAEQNEVGSESTPAPAIEIVSAEAPAAATPEVNHSRTESGSASPSRSLTPVPRLVGKLSRDRFAMFEKTA
ncbi:hypothetical protein BGZ99_008220 [Dissophora globulifera]|uniref:Protein kinase domain-containing protein n=1 Tax=Dissophora globulifera TaxID=979702 RepID=A0A9P6RA67_9FUNG|nr:hypothetical protein BGZ99_008220 [Dissophora globulifera]